MSEQGLWLDPDRAYRGGVDLALAGQAITGQRDGVGAEIAAASADRPWGRDDIGSVFEQKYRGFEATLLKSWADLGGYLEGLGAHLAQSVVTSVETDMASADRVGKTVH